MKNYGWKQNKECFFQGNPYIAVWYPEKNRITSNRHFLSIDCHARKYQCPVRIHNLRWKNWNDHIDITPHILLDYGNFCDIILF